MDWVPKCSVFQTVGWDPFQVTSFPVVTSTTSYVVPHAAVMDNLGRWDTGKKKGGAVILLVSRL